MTKLLLPSVLVRLANDRQNYLCILRVLPISLCPCGLLRVPIYRRGKGSHPFDNWLEEEIVGSSVNVAGTQVTNCIFFLSGGTPASSFNYSLLKDIISLST